MYHLYGSFSLLSVSIADKSTDGFGNYLLNVVLLTSHATFTSWTLGGIWQFVYRIQKMRSVYAKTKTQISFAVTAKLISAFIFATRIV